MNNHNHSSISFDMIASAARRSHTTVEDMVYNALREAIISGAFLPGERLQQDRIAAMLGVSRIPVRASLRQLEADGLVEFRPYRGAIVTMLSTEEIAEIYELRIHLESFALQFVIEQITDEEIAALMALADTMDSEEDPIRWMDARQNFYARLYESAERPRLAKLISNLRGELGHYWMSVRINDDPEGHRELIKRIAARDIDATTQWLKEHLTEVSQQLQQLVADRAISEWKKA